MLTGITIYSKEHRSIATHSLLKKTIPMKSFYILGVLLIGIVFTELSAQDLQKSIAVLDLTERNNESNDARLFSVEHMAKVTGIPFVITDDLSEAVNYGMILSSSLFSNNAFSAEEISQLESYVNEGGVLVAPRIQEEDLFPLFGIESYENSNSRYAIHWDSTLSDASLKYIDETEERTLSLGRSTYDAIYKTLGYTTTTARTLASFTDGMAAVTKNDFGEGAAISIGVSWKEVILRNQLNRDFEAQRISSNGFEPTSDVWPLFIRALFMEHHPYTVWKNTSPGNSEATLMITHDIDSQTGMDTLRVFVDYEMQENIEATYNITVRYFDDELMGPYYVGGQSTMEYILNRGHNIGSHSVGHFFDFADSDIFPIGSPGNTQANYLPFNDGDITTGGTVYGECEVSRNALEEDNPGLEIRTFRAGHLAYPEYLVNVLDELGYQFNSSYSASDVLNNFPFQNKKDRSFSGERSNIYEFPVTISDVFHDDPISAENINSKADTWLEITRKNKANGAPTVLLIHPNRHYKLDGLAYYLNRAPAKLAMMEMQKFGDFWLAREAQEFTTVMNNGQLTIRLTSPLDLPQNVGLVISNGQALMSISVVDENGNQIEKILEDQGTEDVVLYFQDNVTSVKEPIVQLNKIKIFPNPTTGEFKVQIDWPNRSNMNVDVFDVYGKKVTMLMDKVVQAGPVELEASFSEKGVLPGVYFLVVRKDGEVFGRKRILFFN